ncbi:VCBS domain-containing protein [Sagittula salina]|uniref:VCBS domain-containing protein n=1 Tax=Sagittula salina TaxID=2820268 RepID=A0A940MMY1_9RHOB|nr:VCBS domain-containing protein [Sagittula salina]MBP0482488.1 VCBS domain-containing protein [Sagittula salina]
MSAVGRVGHSYDQSREREAFSIDGSAPQVFDAVAIYRATITYTDGSTAELHSANIFQDTDGNTYLASETRHNTDQVALAAKPIAMIELIELRDASVSGMQASRYKTDFVRDEGEITGTLFVDSDGDATQLRDGGGHCPGLEEGIEGVVVVARDLSGAVVAQTITDAQGNYSFTLPTGDYRIEVPTDVNTGPLVERDQGGYRIDSDADQSTGLSAMLSVTPGSRVTNLDFGYEPDQRDGVVDGLGGDEVMGLGYTDGQRDVITDGDDVILGDSAGLTVPREVFRWDAASSRDVDGTFTQDTGSVTVTYARTEDNRWHASAMDRHSRLNLDGISADGLDVDNRGALESRNYAGDGRGAFEWVFSEEVTKVQFNVNDLDGDGVVEVRAYDAAGNPVEVTLTGGARLTVTDSDADGISDTADSQGGYASPSSGDYNLQVQVDGPVARIELLHTQDGRHDSEIKVTDIAFDAGVPLEPGADLIDGADGDDLIYGDTGVITPESAVFSWQGLSSRDLDGTLVQEIEGITVTYARTADDGRHKSSMDGRTRLNTDGLSDGPLAAKDKGALESETNGQSGRGTFDWTFSEEVSNIAFNVNDIDGDGVVRVLAFDAAGNPVEAALTGGSGLAISDSTGDGIDDTADSQGGYGATSSDTYNLQVRIAGPVARIQLEHTQDGWASSGIWVTDILFDAGVAMVDQVTGAGDTITGGAGDDTIFGQGGDDSVRGDTGNDQLDLGAGEDLGIYVTTANLGAQDFYDGGADHDTLRLDMTRDDWFRPEVQTDIAAYLAHLASGDPAPFAFTAFDLTVVRFEALTVLLDGVPIDPADAPVTLGDDAATLDENGFASGDVLVNDSVPDLIRSVELVDDVARGSLTFNADGTYSFDPLGDFDYLGAGESTTEAFTYRVTDADFDSAVATVTLSVTGSNDGVTVQPVDVAGDITEGAVLNDAGTITFTDLDLTDRPSATHAVASVTATAQGGGNLAMTAARQAAIEAAFSITAMAGNTNDGVVNWDYAIAEADLDFLGAGEQVTAVFTITVTDDEGAFAAQDVTITINGTNDAPTVAATAAAGFTEGADASAQDLSDSGVVSFDDLDATDTLDVSFAANGDIAWSGGTLPAGLAAALVAGFATGTSGAAAPGNTAWSYATAGLDLDFLAEGETITWSYTVTATDPEGASASDVVSFTLTGTNDAPELTDDSGRENADVTITGNVLANDSDVDANDGLQVVSAGGMPAGNPVTGQFGQLVVAADGSYSYIADQSLAAVYSLPLGDEISESFTVEVADAYGAVVAQQLTVTIVGINTTPTAVADSAAAVEDGATIFGNVGDNDSDPDTGAVLSFALAAGGTPPDGFSFASDGGWSFDPTHPSYDVLAEGEPLVLTIPYVVTDEKGASAASTLTITVTGTNDTPVAQADVATTTEHAAIAIDVLTNDTDVDTGDTLTVTGATLSGGGSVTTDGAQVFFDPGQDFDGLALDETATATIGYTVSDAQGATATATAEVTVTGENDDPTAGDLAVTTSLGGSTGGGTGSVMGMAFAANGGTMKVLFGTADTDGDGYADSGASNSTPVTPAGTSYGIDSGDIDGDGDIDIVLAFQNGSYPLYVLTNVGDADGDGDDDFHGSALGSGFGTYDVALGDLDGDGDLDAAAYSGATMHWFVNQGDLNGNGRADDFSVHSRSSATTGSSYGIAMADMNGDGRIDVLGASWSSGPTVISLNLGDTNGDGVLEFRDVALEDAYDESSLGVIPADLDGDGDMDFVLSRWNNQNEVVYLNQGNDGSGAPVFTTVELPTSGYNLESEVADIDGDGILDIISVDNQNGFAVIRGLGDTNGDGQIEFAAPQLYGSSSSSYGLAVGDIDFDGDVDVVVAGNNSAGARVYLNDGDTNGDGAVDFVSRPLSDSPVNAWDVEILGDSTFQGSAGSGGQVTGSFDGDDVDSDDDATTLTYTIVTGPAKGTVTNNGDGTFSFDADGAFAALPEGETEEVSFTYTTTDRHGAVSDPATVTVTVEGANDAPVIDGDSSDLTATLQEEGAEASGAITTAGLSTASGQIVASDVDDGDVVSFSGDASNAIGTFDVDETTGAWSYTLNQGTAVVEALQAGAELTQTFQVVATDQLGKASSTEVVLTIDGANDGPDAQDVTLEANFLGNGGFDATPDFTGWTVDNTLTNYSGSATAYIDRSGGLLGGDDAVAVLTMAGNTSSYGTGYGTRIVSDAFTGAAGDTVSFTYNLRSGGDQAIGSAYIRDASTGQIVQTVFNYQTPFTGATGTQQVDVALGQAGEFTLDFRVGSYDASGGRYIGATMEIGYAGITRAGLSEETVYTFDGADFLAGVTDVDGGAPSLFSVATSTQGAAVTLEADGNVTYDARGANDDLAEGEERIDTFDFVVTDGNGGSDTATASITVFGENDAPTLGAGVLAAEEDDGARTLDLASLGDDVDSDDDGSTLSYTIVTGPAEGSASISGTTLTFDPGNGFQDLGTGETRAVSLTVQATDRYGAVSGVETITVTVTGRNDGPVAVTDLAATDEDTSVVIQIADLLGNDTDAEGNTISFVGFDDSGSLGTVTDNGDGTLTYDPSGQFEALDTGDAASDSFTYTVSDGNGGVETGTVQVGIAGVSDGPASFNIVTIGYNSAINTFLNDNGHSSTWLSAAASVTAADLQGVDVAILIRANGNQALTDWVADGGLLITEWAAADWVFDGGAPGASASSPDDTGAGMLTGEVTVYDHVGTDSIVFTQAGLDAGLSDGIAGGGYSQGGATEFFQTFSGLDAGYEILATRPTGETVIVGADYGTGSVLAAGFDWQDQQYSAANGLDGNEQFLLNALNYDYFA